MEEALLQKTVVPLTHDLEEIHTNQTQTYSFVSRGEFVKP